MTGTLDSTAAKAIQTLRSALDAVEGEWPLDLDDLREHAAARAWLDAQAPKFGGLTQKEQDAADERQREELIAAFRGHVRC